MTSGNNLDSWLDKESFRQIVASTPLISIDLIVRNEVGQVLLGQRLNRPAQGYWFVPGGRVRKDERLAAAFERLTEDELGIRLPIASADFLGPFEHFYPDNFSGTDFSTHYVVLGYELISGTSLDTLPVEQHSDYQWFTVPELLASEQVHPHTKLYFLHRNES
jgi:colanic acid biosynthesis protein WcaH